MITFSKLGQTGGIGHQLFQVAAVIAAAEDHHMDWALPPWHHAEYFRGPFKFTIRHSVHTIRQREFTYSKIELGGNNEADMEGYFQSEKHFIRHEQLIRQSFSWAGNNGEPAFFPTAELQQKLHKVTEPGFIHIATHFRRNNLKICTPLPKAYYQQAGDHIRKLAPFSKLRPWRIHIFSDDIPWCREFMRKEETHPYVQWIFHEGNMEIEDLYLMTHCMHHIIANSSFSWWGAWLAAYPGKIVVAPSHDKWFNTSYAFFGQTQDIIPGNWSQVTF